MAANVPNIDVAALQLAASFVAAISAILLVALSGRARYKQRKALDRQPGKLLRVGSRIL